MTVDYVIRIYKCHETNIYINITSRIKKKSESKQTIKLRFKLNLNITYSLNLRQCQGNNNRLADKYYYFPTLDVFIGLCSR